MSAKKKPAGRLSVARLTIHGVLGVEDSVIDLDTITVLSGANATGKSTHLKALRCALGIDRTSLGRLARISDEPAAGEEPSVEVLLVGEDREVQVTRRGGGSPEVRERVGEDWRKVPRPVEWLQRLIDVEAANPALWLASDDETRAAAVLAAMPLEGYRREDALRAAGLEAFRLPPVPPGLHPLVELEQIEDAVRLARTEVNRQERAEHDAGQKLLAGLPAEAPADVAGLLGVAVASAEAQAVALAREEEAAKAAERATVAQARAGRDLAKADIQARQDVALVAARAAHEAALRVELEAIRALHDQESAAVAHREAEWLAHAQETRANSQQALDAFRATLGELRERVATLRAQQQGAETDRHVRATAAAAEEQARVLEEKAAWLTDGISRLQRFRLELAEKLPIKGLSVRFDEKGRKSLALDGVPLSQVNDGRLVELATEVSLLKQGPRDDDSTYLPLVLLDGIERLDPAARRALLREVAARGTQVIAAVVGPDALQALRGEEAVR